ncbi:hypothetical protein [Prescottella sp. R16]|uniref:hypothetical protein n=1 Tax=Prescottella sp. R16 TaxID=3064529 RepID=UPI00351D46C9
MTVDEMMDLRRQTAAGSADRVVRRLDLRIRVVRCIPGVAGGVRGVLVRADDNTRSRDTGAASHATFRLVLLRLGQPTVDRASGRRATHTDPSNTESRNQTNPVPDSGRQFALA